MKTPGQWFDLSRPWHLVFGGTLPVLALVAPNIDELSLAGALWPLVAGTAVVLLGWVTLAWMVGDGRAAALSITVLAIATLSYPNVTRLAEAIGLGPAWLYLLIIVICFGLLHTTRLASELTVFVNVLLSIVAIAFAVQIAWSELRRSTVVAPPLEAEGSPGAGRPDVYVLVLDGYGRSDVLRDIYGFDNDLGARLEQRGFFIAGGAHSNYAQTTQSLASSLNLDYLASLFEGIPEGARSRRSLADLINHNRMFAMLGTAGYRIESYDSEYDLISPSGSRGLHPWFHVTHFGFSYYEGTALPKLFGVFGLPPSELLLRAHRRNVRWVLDHLEAGLESSGDSPTLVFAHLLIPHPPFVFNADGTDRHTNLASAIWDGDHWQTAAAGRGERYATGYVDSVRYLNHRLVTFVDRVLNRRRPAIVLIHGDHGPGSRLQWEDPEATDMRERFGILLAVRFPDTNYGSLYPDLTPVNATRAVLNHAIGTNLPKLADQSFFATWSRPFELIEVTDRLRAMR